VGLACKEEYECFCKPCIKAFDVDVFQYFGDSNDKAGHGCEKMSLCGEAEQTKEITFHAVDNRKRENVKVEVLMHLDREKIVLDVEEIHPYTYQFLWSHGEIGVDIIEIFFNGEQISESPIRLQIVERQCDVDFPG